MRFKKLTHWWTNVFWYHYKWHTIILLFLGAVIWSAVAGMAGQERPDFTYLFAVEGLPAGQDMLEEWDQAALELLADVNGDGKVVISGVALGFSNDEFGMAARTKFTAEMSGGDALLAVMDAVTLMTIEDQGDYFLPLGELGLPSDPERPWTRRVEPPAVIRAIGIKSDFYLCVKALGDPDDPGMQVRYEQAATFARMLIELSTV